MKKKLIASLAVFLGFAAMGFAAPAKTLEITGDDTMRFNVTSLEAPAGEEIELTFKNVGSLPKAAMGHNVVILEPGTDVAVFAAAAMKAADNEYIPTEQPHKGQVIAHTEMLGPKEEDTITFTLPEPGEYTFICSFPGHYALMQGTITAK